MKQKLLIALSMISGSSFGATVFFGGDPSAVRRELIVGSTFGTLDEVYDDFDIEQTTRVESLFADCYPWEAPATGLGRFEIRAGLANGVAGTVVASAGSLSYVSSPLTTGIPTTAEFNRYRISGLNIQLEPGRYWLMMYFDHNLELAVTSGLNGVGGPIGNGGAYLTSVFRSSFFAPIGGTSGNPAPDFAYGVEGTVVPEPGTVAAVAIGFGAFARHMIRRKALAIPRAL